MLEIKGFVLGSSFFRMPQGRVLVNWMKTSAVSWVINQSAHTRSAEHRPVLIGECAHIPHVTYAYRDQGSGS